MSSGRAICSRSRRRAAICSEFLTARAGLDVIEADEHHALFTFTRNPGARAKLVRDLVGAGFEVSSFGESSKALEDAYFAQVTASHEPGIPPQPLARADAARRVILMVVLLALVFFAAALSGGHGLSTVGGAARAGCTISSSWCGARAMRR